MPLAFWKNDQLSIVSVADTLGSNGLIVFQMQMNDPSIVGVHLADGHGLVNFLGLLGHFGSHSLQVGLTRVEISLDIDQYSQPGIVIFVNDFFDQILYRLEGLASLSDQKTTITALDFKNDPVILVLGSDRGPL